MSIDTKKNLKMSLDREIKIDVILVLISLIFILGFFYLDASITGHIIFDPLVDSAFMGCSFNDVDNPNCEIGTFTVDDSRMEGGDYIASGSWCNSSSGYYKFEGIDQINYSDVGDLTNLTNMSIVIGFTTSNPGKYGGIVSLYDKNLSSEKGWSVRTRDDGYLGWRMWNGTADRLITLDENNHTGLLNDTNYTLVITFDGKNLRAWLNNTQIEKNTWEENVVAHPDSQLRLGLYTTTGNIRFSGQIHFVYIYNYTLTPEQVVNRTLEICGQNLYNIGTQRYGVWPLSNTSLPDFNNESSYDIIADPYGYRPFALHANDLDFHRGIDIANISGIPIVAVMNGTAVRVENTSDVEGTSRTRFGNWVLIEHSPDPDTGQPRHTAYMHMNNTPTINETDKVVQGQILGYTGKTGTDIIKEHLHFELLKDLNEDIYTNMSAIHPFNIINYTYVKNTTLFVYENETHYYVNFTSGNNDLGFVKIKFQGSLVNRTINYETKEGLDENSPDISCVSQVCFLPAEWDPPYHTYEMSFIINKSYIGNLEAVIIEDVQGNQIILPDTAKPLPVITNPTNNYESDSSNVTFNSTMTDNLGLSNSSIYGNWSEIWHRNITMNVNGTSNSSNFTVVGISNGIYLWGIQACDNFSNCNWTENRTLIINVVAVASPDANEPIPEVITEPIKGGSSSGSSDSPQSFVSNIQTTYQSTSYIFDTLSPITPQEILTNNNVLYKLVLKTNRVLQNVGIEVQETELPLSIQKPTNFEAYKYFEVATTNLPEGAITEVKFYFILPGKDYTLLHFKDNMWFEVEKLSDTTFKTNSFSFFAIGKNKNKIKTESTSEVIKNSITRLKGLLEIGITQKIPVSDLILFAVLPISLMLFALIFILYLLYIHFSNKHRLLKLIKKYKKSSGCINKGDAKKLATEIKKRYHRLKQKDKLKYLHLFQGLIKNKKF